MRKSEKLDSFVIVQGGTIISPTLTTTRQYGIWLQNIFGNDIAAQELFLKVKRNGVSLLESHPGTRIGNYFDSNKFSKYELKCWYISSDSDVMEKLVMRGLADRGDCCKFQDNQMLRLYTTDQIQLYIKTKIDRDFDIGNMLCEPKQIVTTDISKIVKPEKQKKRGLF